MTDPSDTRVTGWKLERAQRAELLERFPPVYPEVVADHVTLESGLGRAAPPPPKVSAEIVGVSDDGLGVQAMVVAVDGATDRPDGSTFHITWSLGPGRNAVESNEVIRERGWTALDPTPVRIHPAIFH